MRPLSLSVSRLFLYKEQIIILISSFCATTLPKYLKRSFMTPNTKQYYGKLQIVSPSGSIIGCKVTLGLFSDGTLCSGFAQCSVLCCLRTSLCFMRSLYLSYSRSQGQGLVQFTLWPSCDWSCCSGILQCWSSTAPVLTTPEKDLESKTWGEGGRGRGITKREKERERERESMASKCYPVVVAMPRAKQAFYQFLGLGFILVLWVSAS